MSVPEGYKPTNVEDVFSSENRCLLSVIFGRQAIEQDEGIAIDVRCLTLLKELATKAEGEDVCTCYEEILNGKCQRENWSEISTVWGSLQTSVQSLSKPELEKLPFTFLRKLASEGMQCGGTMSISKITEIFFETCRPSFQQFGTDNSDGFHEENINLKMDMCSQPLEVSSSAFGEDYYGASGLSGHANDNGLSEVSASSEVKASLMRRTKSSDASGKQKIKKPQKESKVSRETFAGNNSKKPPKENTLSKISASDASGEKEIEKSQKENKVSRVAFGGNNSKKPPKENTLSKASASLEAKTSLIHAASSGNNAKKHQKKSSPSKVLPSSSFEAPSLMCSLSTCKKPGKKAKNKVPNQRSTPLEASSLILEDDSDGASGTSKHGNDYELSEVCTSSEESSSMISDGALASGAREKPRKYKTSIKISAFPEAKASLMTRTKSSDASGEKEIEKSQKENMVSREAFAGNNSKKPPKENTLSKASASLEAKTCLIHAASSGNNTKKYQKKSSPSKVLPSSSFESPSQMCSLSTCKKPGKKAKNKTPNQSLTPLEASSLILGDDSYGASGTSKHGNDYELSEVCTSSEESSSMISDGALTNGAREKAQRYKKSIKVSAFPEEEASSMRKTKSSDAISEKKKIKKPRKESKLSVRMQASCSERQRMLSKPMEDEIKELKAESVLIQTELFTTRDALSQVQNENKELKLQNLRLDDTIKKLLLQIQIYIERLKGYESMDYSRTNSTL